uniref:Uncharacterized protein n=1 Tax=Arundo donax TaxID=35708 RepID=A0A0A9BF31_ARUDO
MTADHATTSRSLASPRSAPATPKSPHLACMLMSAFLTNASPKKPSFTTTPWTWRPARKHCKPAQARRR